MSKGAIGITENARNESPDDVDRFRVNRADELRLLINTFKYSDGNVFLYGPRGVGKTFLLKMLARDLRIELSEFFVFWFPIQMRLGAAKYSDKTIFPISFLLDMLSCAWNSLGGRSFSDLIATAIIEEERIAIEDKKFEYMKKLALALRAPEEKSHYKRESTLGASAVLKGELTEDWGVERTVSDAFSQDIYKHMQEFKDIVLEKFGIKKIVALCDEANLMPEEWQKHIITNHLHFLSDYRVQFVFVADFVPGLSEINIPDYFDVNIGLEGMPQNDTAILIDKKYKQFGFSFDDGAIKVIFDACCGNPRIALIITNLAISSLDHKAIKQISTDAAARAVEKYAAQRERLLKEAKANGRRTAG